MQVDLLADSWEALNQEVSAWLATGQQLADLQIRVYPGVMSAVFENAFGLALFHSHKKNCALCKGNSYVFQGVLPYLYKEGMQVQFLEATCAQDFRLVVEGLKKDTSFVLVAEDHPVTGEIFPVDELEQLLSEKKIFCIRVSHYLWRRGLRNLSSFSVRICVVDGKNCFAQLGEKWKVPPMTTQFFDWRESTFLSILQKTLQEFQEDEKNIQDLEASLPAGWQKWQFVGPRIYDRAVIYNPTLNAEAVMDFILRKKIQLAKALPGYPTPLECVNFARWQSFNLLDWWEPQPTPEQIRGLLLLAPQFFVNLKMRQIFAEAEVECRI